MRALIILQFNPLISTARVETAIVKLPQGLYPMQFRSQIVGI